MEINENSRTGGKVQGKSALVTVKYRINKTKLKRRLWFLGILALLAGVALFKGNIYTYLADKEYKKHNYGEAVRLYEKVAASNAKAQTQLGIMYENGLGVSIDLDKAVEFYTLAAEKGNAKAMYNLAEFHDGYYGLPVDYKKALDLYTKSAEKGYNKALQAWAVISYGRVDPDLKRLRNYFGRLQNRGSSAWENLGQMHLDGHGVPIDLEKYKECYREAIAIYQDDVYKDDVFAFISLGNIFYLVTVLKWIIKGP